MKKHMRASDGKYHINGKTYEILEGSRAQVHHGTAYKTPGGLKKQDLFYNKHGRVVSRKKHLSAKKEKRLEKHGFFAQKGKFGAVKKTVKKQHRSRRNKGKRAGTKRHRRR